MIAALTPEWIVLLASCLIVEAAWLRVLRHFYRQYRSRENPISLAIAGMVAFVMFLVLSIPFVYTRVPTVHILLVNQILCLVIAGFFNYALRVAATRFPESRRRDPETP